MNNNTDITRTFTRRAIENEVSRRKNNRKRRANGQKPARSQSWVFPALGKDDLDDLLAGRPITVAFKSGRVETVAIEES